MQCFRIDVPLGWRDRRLTACRCLGSGWHPFEPAVCNIVWEASSCCEGFVETDVFTLVYQFLFSAAIKYSKEATSVRKDS